MQKLYLCMFSEVAVTQILVVNSQATSEMNRKGAGELMPLANRT